MYKVRREIEQVKLPEVDSRVPCKLLRQPINLRPNDVDTQIADAQLLKLREEGSHPGLVVGSESEMASIWAAVPTHEVPARRVDNGLNTMLFDGGQNKRSG